MWHYPPSCPWGAELPTTAVQEALLEKQTISCVLGFCQFPALNQSVPGPLAHPQISCILPLVSGWDSKLQVFKGLVMCAPTPVPRQGG